MHDDLQNADRVSPYTSDQKLLCLVGFYSHDHACRPCNPECTYFSYNKLGKTCENNPDNCTSCWSDKDIKNRDRTEPSEPKKMPDAATIENFETLKKREPQEIDFTLLDQMPTFVMAAANDPEDDAVGAGSNYGGFCVCPNGESYLATANAGGCAETDTGGLQCAKADSSFCGEFTDSEFKDMFKGKKVNCDKMPYRDRLKITRVTQYWNDDQYQPGKSNFLFNKQKTMRHLVHNKWRES